MTLHFGFRFPTIHRSNPHTVRPTSSPPRSKKTCAAFFCRAKVSDVEQPPVTQTNEAPAQNLLERDFFDIKDSPERKADEDVTEKSVTLMLILQSDHVDNSTRLSTSFLEQNPRILIADDSSFNLKFAIRTALKLGFTQENIVTAENGSDAFAKYESAIEKENPFNVVFSDRDMGESANRDDGDILAQKIHNAGHRTAFVLISGTPPADLQTGMGLICEKGKVDLETIKNYLESY